jgi:hypothetical protein
VHKSFRANGLEIGFKLSGRPGAGGRAPPDLGLMTRGFSHPPNFKRLIEQTDSNGKQGNFLASVQDRDFVCGRARPSLN